MELLGRQKEKSMTGSGKQNDFLLLGELQRDRKQVDMENSVLMGGLRSWLVKQSQTKCLFHPPLGWVNIELNHKMVNMVSV